MIALNDCVPQARFMTTTSELLVRIVLSWLGSEAASKPSRAYSSQAAELNGSGLEPAWLGDYAAWSRSSRYKPIDFPFLDMPTLNGNP
jgi:hypothetical protein